MMFGYIQPIDRALSGATIPVRDGPGSNGIEGVFRIPQSSKHHRNLILFSVLFRTLIVDLTTLQMCSRCILKLQSTGQYTAFMSKQFISDNSVEL